MKQEFIEVEARSVDEAVILGLTRLGAMREEVKIEVLQEGSRGFLGFGARLAKVRLIRLAPLVKPSPQPESSKSHAVVEASPEPEPLSETTPPKQQILESSSPPPAAAKPESTAPTQPEPAAPARLKQKSSRSRTKSKKRSSLLRQQVTQATLDIAQHLFADLEVHLQTSWQQEERPILWLSLKGKDAHLLVGPRAQVLDSIQYLMRTLVHHRVEGNYNVVVDADGYRRRRLRSLESLVKKKVEQAIRSGHTVRLRPMPPNERRLVHMLLQDDKRIRTRSVGSGRNRSVTIIPNESTAPRRQ